jgi:hypothetical protein
VYVAGCVLSVVVGRGVVHCVATLCQGTGVPWCDGGVSNIVASTGCVHFLCVQDWYSMQFCSGSSRVSAGSCCQH